MPTFTSKGGADVYIPWHAVVALQEQPGGLETAILTNQTTIMLTQQGVAATGFSMVVQGTLAGTIQAFKAEQALVEHFPEVWKQ